MEILSIHTIDDTAGETSVNLFWFHLSTKQMFMTDLLYLDYVFNLNYSCMFSVRINQLERHFLSLLFTSGYTFRHSFIRDAVQYTCFKANISVMKVLIISFRGNTLLEMNIFGNIFYGVIKSTKLLLMLKVPTSNINRGSHNKLNVNTPVRT